jgi:4-alpha-glucanotransferase
MQQRRAGILLHPTSLPGPTEAGYLGPQADRFLDWAAAAGFSLWQVLPLGPPHGNQSPYGTLSAFAGNARMISLDRLLEHGLLTRDELAAIESDSPPASSGQPSGRRQELLRRAWQRLRRSREGELLQEFEAFRSSPANRHWLADWALFAALRRHHAGAGWWSWDTDLARREPGALERARRQLAEPIDFEEFLQFEFRRQWQRVRLHARSHGVLVIGDLPIYVALDSADVWAHPSLFDLDGDGRPNAVAGVPPDYFSADGQMWGNPLYNWPAHEQQGFLWWRRRLQANLELADAVRLDHFRGFASYWRVPRDAATARQGRWLPGPGMSLFTALRDDLGALPLVAEDLGEITPDVHELRREAGLPSMRVLQFGFDPLDGDHAPHRLSEDTVLYTGTHDNDTVVGWYHSLSPSLRQQVLDYTGASAADIHWHMIRVAYTSVSRWAIVPMQDVLGLDSAARMNRPGVAEGNWRWKLMELLSGNEAARLHHLAELSGRLPAVSNPAATPTQIHALSADGRVGTTPE